MTTGTISILPTDPVALLDALVVVVVVVTLLSLDGEEVPPLDGGMTKQCVVQPCTSGAWD
jgi:hypothetical protein